MSHQQILVVYPQKTSFVKNDIQLLSEFYTIKQQQFFLKKGLLTFIYYQFKGILELFINIPSSDLVYIWFNDYHAFWTCLIAKLFSKKVVIVVGGYDAVSIPTIKFGLFYKRNFRTKLAQWTYKNCQLILPVDKSLVKGENNYAGVGSITGILHFIPTLKTPINVVPTGYKDSDWYAKPKKRQVLTVGQLTGEKVFKRKGIDLFLELAAQMPEINFILVGLMQKDLVAKKYHELPNLVIYPMVEKEKLRALYAESKVYAQFSLSEGLPNVLCEAMMSECIPVGSNVNGIPDAIGDCGYILSQPNIEEAKLKIFKALENNEMGKLARKRILTKFPISKRKNLLKNFIDELLN